MSHEAIFARLINQLRETDLDAAEREEQGLPKLAAQRWASAKAILQIDIALTDAGYRSVAVKMLASALSNLLLSNHASALISTDDTVAGRPKRPFTVAMFQQCLSAYVEWLADNEPGTTLMAAMLWAARILSDDRYNRIFPGPRPITARTIRGWRDDVLNDRQVFPSQELYLETQQILKSLGAAVTRKSLRESLEADLAELVQQLPENPS